MRTYQISDESPGSLDFYVVVLFDLFIDVSLEVQNQNCCLILYLMDYIVYGFHLWYRNLNIQGNLPETNFLTSWLRQQSAPMQRVFSKACDVLDSIDCSHRASIESIIHGSF